jgi:uncharacterized delta-60 repeat protein
MIRARKSIASPLALHTAILYGAASAPAQAFPTDVDTTFGTAGDAITDVAGQSIITSAALQADGHLIAAGLVVYPATVTSPSGVTGSVLPSRQVVIARYDTRGVLDSTFGSGGIAAPSLPSSIAVTQPYDLAIAADDKVVVGGTASVTDANVTSIVRYQGMLLHYTKDGMRDSSFGNNGIVDAVSVARFDAVALQADGKILAAGPTYSTTMPAASVTVTRFESNGTIDETFGNSGVATINGVHDTDTSPCRLAVDTTGRIVLLGAANDNTHVGLNDWALVRLTPDGAFDSSFGNNGYVASDFGGDDIAISMQIDTHDRIVVGGSTSQGAGFSLRHALMARYTPDGALDKSFTNGTFTIAGSDQIRRVYVNADSSILVASVGTGVVGMYGYPTPAFARFAYDGTPDINFGSKGIAVGSYTSGVYPGFANDFVLTSSGKIVAAGGTQAAGPSASGGGASGGMGGSGMNSTTSDYWLRRYEGVSMSPGPYKVETGASSTVKQSGGVIDTSLLLLLASAWFARRTALKQQTRQ